MDPALFTEKPLKVLKNSSGLNQELFHSKLIHSQNIPLLVSSQVLRSRGLGQIDIACLNQRREIEIYEVKSSCQGTHLSYQQRLRLQGSLALIMAILPFPGRLVVLK